MMLLSLLLGWSFEKAHVAITAKNYNSVFNGYGSISLVLSRESKAPMAYRVLVPWLVWLLEKLHLRRIGIYQGLKVILNSLALYAVTLVFGMPAAILTTVLLLVTIKYDYWDWAAEMMGVCFALTGDPALASVGAVVAGLSRETALLVPAAYFLKTGDINTSIAVTLVTLVTLYIPRWWAGKKPLYCDRVQIKYNASLFKAFTNREFWAWGHFYHQDIVIALLISAGAVASILLRGSLDGLIPLAILAAGWVMAKADETRVFALCLPWIALTILGGS